MSEVIYMAEAKADFGQKLDRMQARMRHMEQRFEDSVREHPIRSVGIAFGAGLAAGALYSWYRNRR
jgi:ElaB/YqjD/DUF883 family membrane-anchored ribosome-binding protein